MFLINSTPSSVLNGKSPFELVYKRSPNFDNLRIFGCLCFSTKLNVHDKFSERAEKCVLLGYSLEQKGYTLSLDSNSIFVSRDVKFYESVFPFKMKNTSSDTSTSTGSSMSWDPFSYDESALSVSPSSGDTNPGALGSGHQLSGTNSGHFQSTDTTDATPGN